MITLEDLETAIAHCQGEQNPDAKTCIKLAAYYTIRDAMYGDRTLENQPAYDSRRSYDAGPEPESVVEYLGTSRFAHAVRGLPAAQAWAVVDELMDVLAATNQRLHDGVMRELAKI